MACARIALTATLLAPWVLFNHRAFGVYSFAPSFASRGSIGKYLTAYSEYRYAAPPTVIFPDLKTKNANGVLSSRAFITAVRQTFIEDPLPYFVITLIHSVPFFIGDGWFSMIRTLNPTAREAAISAVAEQLLIARDVSGIVELFSLKNFVFIFGKIVYAVLFLGSAFGAYRLFCARNTRMFALTLTCVILYFMVISGVGSYARFRYPASACMFILVSGVLLRSATTQKI